jgi:Homeodomain-like domain
MLWHNGGVGLDQGGSIMPDTTRKFKIELTKKEREELLALLRKQSVGAALQRRTRILLLADSRHPDGRRTDANIAELVGLCERQVVRIRQKFVRERDSESVTVACERKPRPPAPERRRLDGKAEAQLVVLACSTPPADRDAWTLQMLCDELARLEVVESVCPETVRRCLKKMTFSRGGSNATASRKRTGRDS